MKLIVLILLGGMMSGYMVSGGNLVEPEPVVIGDPPRETNQRQSHYRKGRKHHINIPVGHMPPEGKCRIGYYNRPPGHQPPPVSCPRIGGRIPYEAVLVRG